MRCGPKQAVGKAAGAIGTYDERSPDPKATHFDEQPRYQRSYSIIGAHAERPRTLATQAYFEVANERIN
jgi:hypothetical protein